MGMPKTPSCRRIFKERLKLFAGPNPLYSDKNPVEYPMHMVKDCTPRQNLRSRDRIVHWMKNWAPRMVELKASREQEAERQTLRKFRHFLKRQYEVEGSEAAERMSLDELVAKAERDRIENVLDSNMGKDVPKRPIKVYPGTQIPRRRVSRKKTRCGVAFGAPALLHSAAWQSACIQLSEHMGTWRW